MTVARIQLLQSARALLDKARRRARTTQDEFFALSGHMQQIDAIRSAWEHDRYLLSQRTAIRRMEKRRVRKV